MYFLSQLICKLLLINYAYWLFFSKPGCHCDSSRNNATTVKNETQACNCSGSSINCTSGFHYVNNTCVQCSCNTTKLPSNCNCSDDQESGQKVFCGPGYFLANASEGIYCRNCSCNMETSVSNICDNKTGQCLCKPYVIGRQCNICASNYSASYSRTGNLMNCSQEQGKCPAGFNRTVKSDPPFYECVEQQNSTVIPDKTGQVVSTNAPITTNKLHSSTASTSRGKHSSTNHPTSMPRSTHRTDYSSTGSSTTHGNTGSKTPEKGKETKNFDIIYILLPSILHFCKACCIHNFVVQLLWTTPHWPIFCHLTRFWWIVG